MGLVCSLILQPVTQLVFIVVSVIEFILVTICRMVTFVTMVLVTHHKYRLAKDPEYELRRSNCGGARKDGMKASGHMGIALVLAAAGLVVSAYLAFVMIAKIGALCATCINIAALNVLLVWQLVR